MKALFIAMLAVVALCEGTAHALSSQHRNAGIHANSGNPIVSTPYGQVQGITELDTINAFRAIPFAQPPVGQLRFAPTVPLQSGWSGVLDGTQPSAGCTAYCPNTSFPRPVYMCPTKTSEDCLYLNVYTPTLDTNAKLPVLVFYHGGNYQFGAAGVPLYDGSSLAKTQNIVVVTTNYRLNIFGALYNGDTIRGNFQTQDQRQALKFVSEIIESFGGDKNSVTISGQSAGAFSVATHLSAPKSWPYFHKAIIVSDPFSLPSLPVSDALGLMEKTVAFVGCPTTPGPAQVACLRNVSAEKLLEASQLRFVNISDPVAAMMQWTPVVDADELPMQPFTALTTGNFNKVPIFLGGTTNESVQFIYDLSDVPISPIMYDVVMELVFGLERGAEAMQLYGPVPPQFQNDTRQFLSVPATDFIFYCATRAVARAATTLVPVYYWLFDYLGSWNEWVFGSTMSFCVDNVCHAEDLPFIFNPFAVPVPGEYNPTPKPSDLDLINNMQTAWGNFVKTGNPNPLQFGNGGALRTYNGMEANMLNYSVPLGLISGFRDSYCDFWDKGGYIH